MLNDAMMGAVGQAAARSSKSLGLPAQKAGATRHERDVVRPCLALIAPGNRHMALRRAGTRYIAEIVDGQHISRHRPSVDVLFRSASQMPAVMPSASC